MDFVNDWVIDYWHQMERLKHEYNIDGRLREQGERAQYGNKRWRKIANVGRLMAFSRCAVKMENYLPFQST